MGSPSGANGCTAPDFKPWPDVKVDREQRRLNTSSQHVKSTVLEKYICKRATTTSGILPQENFEIEQSVMASGAYSSKTMLIIVYAHSISM